MIGCICIQQQYDNRKKIENEVAESDGSYFEEDLLKVVISYEEAVIKVNYCPF